MGDIRLLLFDEANRPVYEWTLIDPLKDTPSLWPISEICDNISKCIELMGCECSTNEIEIKYGYIEELKRLVDTIGLPQLLEDLAKVCSSKASSLSDAKQIRYWQKLANTFRIIE